MAEGITSPVRLGRVCSSDNLGTELHNGARTGSKRQIKKALGRGIHVDYPNDRGQSPLFCACHENQVGVAELLLSYGANPNEKSGDCITPIHITAYNGNIRLLTQLLSAGGDLRLHDGNGRTSKDWALLQPDAKKRLKMLEFLEKTRLFAMTKSGHDIRVDYGTNRSHGLRNNSVIRLIKDKIKGSPDVSLEQVHTCQSMGFGKVYLDGESSSGFVSTIPLVTETCLKHDSERLTYENGAFMVMESMTWRRTQVTAKRLHRETEIGGEVDLLINEIEHLGKLRHPSILCVMGVCQTNNLDGLVLLFESINLGSLYYHLHHQMERMPTNQITEITKQICDALIFIHEQNMLHCYITSHAINLVGGNSAKLGNLEYMMESDKANIGKRSLVNMNIYQNAAYNWMAPEIMNETPPCTASDMYSFCVVIWEMIHCEIPWGHVDIETLKCKIIEEREQLLVRSGRTPQIYQCLLDYGLQLDPLHRKLKFNNMRDILKLSPEQSVKQYIERLSKPGRPSKSPVEGKQHSKPASPVRDIPEPDQRYENQGATAKGASRQTSRQPDNQHKMVQRNTNRHSRKNLTGKDRMPMAQEETVQKHQKLMRDQYGGDGLYPELGNYVVDGTHPTRFTDGMNFTHKNLKWNLQEEQEGDQYHYTIDVNKNKEDSDDADRTSENMYKDTYVHYRNVVPSESEGTYEETCSSQTSTEVSIPLESKFSRPLAKFSYLQIQQLSSPPGTSIKPASHCVEPSENVTGGQLTTKGSVYALYNQLNHTTDQYITPDNSTSDYRGQYTSTMPRKRKRMGATPNFQETKGETVDRNWFGGKGSVRNLVDLYQHQADGHQFKQAVLDGQVKDPLSQISQRELLEEQDPGNYCNNGKVSPRSPRQQPRQNEFPDGGQKRREKIGSPSSKSPQNKHKGREIKSTRKDDANDSSLTTISPEEVNRCSSPESDMVSSWVSQELQKVSSSLSDEIFTSLAEKQTREYVSSSPLLFGKKVLPQNTHGKTPHKSKKKSHKENKYPKTYRTEELYMSEEFRPKNYNERQMKLHSAGGESLSRRRSSFIMPPETSTDGQIQEYSKSNKDEFGRQFPRYVPASEPSVYQKLKNRSKSKGAYESTVTVKSSLTDPEQHFVSHTVKDLSDGTTSTVYGKSVRASKVVSSLFTQD